jgi:fluoroacetyl-CoA thioesterase
MNREDAGQIVFDERHTVAAEHPVRRKLRQLPREQPHADGPVATMTGGRLVTLLESLCLRELQRCLDPATERAVGQSIRLRYSAAIPCGALLRIRGWVHSIGDRDVTFFVHAQDDQEQVCEGTVRLVVIGHDELERRIERKVEAIARRELFLAA